MKLVIVDPSVAGDVFYFLWPHFLKFYREVLTFIMSLSLLVHFYLNSLDDFSF